MNKAAITQKVSAVILVLVTLWAAIVSWLNYSFVSEWQGRISELTDNNASLMAVFSVGYWPVTILIVMSCAVTTFYLFKNNTLPILFNVALVIIFVVSTMFIHMLAVSTGFELHAISKG
ncbi:MAG: hypothetical protein OEZ39_05295 [Gammaproteobacteria bacterium]|nr:hypothetical protein [Gammaproteobacteria bacterium]MDH5651269.1 hypothetical protein [Gammaproteobacteria bacterium]